jgi:hypothetical protein
MIHPVAPGAEGYNLLSKRHIFRIVILNDVIDDDGKRIKGPMVLEAKDGSYKHEIEFADAMRNGSLLTFEFQVRHRRKEYLCYVKDSSRKFRWELLPIGMVSAEHFVSEEGNPQS